MFLLKGLFDSLHASQMNDLIVTGSWTVLVLPEILDELGGSCISLPNLQPSVVHIKIGIYLGLYGFEMRTDFLQGIV